MVNLYSTGRPYRPIFKAYIQAHNPPMDLQNFKDLMARFPTGVSIATSRMDGEPVGMTVSSFVSISLNPQIVMISVVNGFKLTEAIQASKSFGISILCDDQAALGAAFANRDLTQADRFSKGFFETGSALGMPILTDGVASMEMKLHEAKVVGDHTLFFGEVVDGTIKPTCHPMVYWNRDWAKITG